MKSQNAMFTLLMMLALTSTASDKTVEITALEMGADIYNRYCVLCHGNQGMGDGLLPIKIDGYPNANLLLKIKAKTKTALIDTIQLGNQLKGVDPFMPPYQVELNTQQIDALAELILLMRKDTEASIKLLARRANAQKAVNFSGRVIYKARCVLCHGTSGIGDGRMARIIKNPPPADLTASRINEAMMLDIITNGGQGVGRSPQMPPWKDQLTEPEIKELISYIKSIRVVK